MPDGDIESKEDNLIAKIVGSAPNLPTVTDSEPERFFAEVKALLERRAQQDWVNENEDDQSAVFVLVDYPRKPFHSAKFSLDRVIDLPVTNEQVHGKVFFLSFNAGNGTSMPMPVGANEILDWLSQNGLGNCPIVIAYRDTHKLSSRMSAEQEDVSWQTIRNKQPDLSIDSLKDALSVFHSDSLMSPSSCGAGVWEPQRSAEYVPAKNTEKAIQLRLRSHLTGWFRGIVKVGTEDPINNGRIDVRLLAPPQSGHGLQYWSIIELKIVKSFRNAKIGKKAGSVGKSSLISDILKGIGQAHEFTSDREVQEGFLEVYDMRKNKSEDLFDDAKVKKKFDTCTVTVNANLRPMFGSAEEARDFTFGAA